MDRIAFNLHFQACFKRQAGNSIIKQIKLLLTGYLANYLITEVG
jgi:hypothetical protein